MMTTKRLLCIVGGMNAGGAETFLMKLYRNLDRERFQMDFAVAISEKGFYDEEILSLGGKIYHIIPKSQGFFKNFQCIKKIVRDNRYCFVLRVSQHSLSALELFAARLGGARTLIFRSSNSNTVTGMGKDSILHKLCLFMPRLFSNVKLAPSTEAAEFMFGKNSVSSGKVSLLNNAIDLDVFQYNSREREQIRKEFALENKLVVGHVGRFSQQKNHTFLLGVFCDIYRKNKNAVLLLVGKGELESSIRTMAAEMGIENNVVFTGIRSDVPQILSAMDVFVFPSFYEGMPNTVIEAQATGLPCVIADTITQEANITGLVQYLSLSDSPEIWAGVALEAANAPRKNTKQDFIDKHYDIQSTVDEFVRLCFQE